MQKNEMAKDAKKKRKRSSEVGGVIMFEYYVPWSLLCRSPGLVGLQRNHLGQWPP